MYLETHYENVDHTQVGGTFSAGGQFSGVHKTFHAEQWSELHDVITPTDWAAPTKTWNEIRAERDALLNASDWMAMSDRTITDAQSAYRQALRDVPQDFANPSAVVWPTP